MKRRCAFAQQRQGIFRFFSAGTVNHNQVVDRIDPQVGLAETAEGTRQQAVQHFIFQRIFFGLLKLAALLRFQLVDFRFQRLFHHRRGQDFLFFAGANHNLAFVFMGQRIAAVAHRRDPAGLAHILTATR